MDKYINTITNGIYEGFQYKGYGINLNEVINFIKEKYNLPIFVRKPNIYVLDLEVYDTESEIKEGDYILRSCKDMPYYQVMNHIYENFKLIS